MKSKALPDPPSDLAKRELYIIEYANTFFRTHDVDKNAVFFGKTARNRFDDPLRSFGVLYAAKDPACAFLETFGHSTDARVISTGELQEKALSELKVQGSLRLVDLTRTASLRRIGADSLLFAGDYRAAQVWSRTLHDHPTKPDGVLYPSRLDPKKCAIALFEDRVSSVISLQCDCWYSTGMMRNRLAKIVELYKFDLIESRSISPKKPPDRQTSLRF